MTLQLQPDLRPRRPARPRWVEPVAYVVAGLVALVGGALLAAWTNGDLGPEPAPEVAQAVPAPSRTAPSVVLAVPEDASEPVPRVAPPELAVRTPPEPPEPRTVPVTQSSARNAEITSAAPSTTAQPAPTTTPEQAVTTTAEPTPASSSSAAPEPEPPESPIPPIPPIP